MSTEQQVMCVYHGSGRVYAGIGSTVQYSLFLQKGRKSASEQTRYICIKRRYAICYSMKGSRH